LDNNTNKAEVKAEVQKPFRPKKRKKVCTFCADKIEHIDYKDTLKLRRNLSERSNVLLRRVSGTCATHDGQLTDAVNRP